MTLDGWRTNLLLTYAPSKPKNLTKNRVIYTIYIFSQSHKVLKILDFILWKRVVLLSKATLFLSCQMIQKRLKGASIQIFLRFLPTRIPCQERRVLSSLGKTQLKPKIAHKVFEHSCNGPENGTRSPPFHIRNISWPTVFLYVRADKSEHFSLSFLASHTKKSILVGTMGFHMDQ